MSIILLKICLLSLSITGRDVGGAALTQVQAEDEAAPFALTGKTAQESKTALFTMLSTDSMAKHNSALTSRFDAQKVQQSLDMQREVSKDFNQTSQSLRSELRAKAEAATQSGEIEKAQQLEQIGIAVDMLSGGLSTPSGNALATAANTLSPALSYQLGQWAKANDKEGSAEHIAAHMLLGAISGKANDSNALITALSAGGAEAAAPMLADLIYGKAANQLSAKEKDNLAALASLFGTAVGASTGNSLDAIHAANAAENAVGNNQVADLNVFGLMPQVIASDRSAAELYAALLKNGMTPEEASKEAQESLKGNPPKTDPTLVYLTASTAVPAVPAVTAAIATAPAVISGAYYGCISNPALCTEVGIIGTEVTAGLATGAVIPNTLPIKGIIGLGDNLENTAIAKRCCF